MSAALPPAVAALPVVYQVVVAAPHASPAAVPLGDVPAVDFAVHIPVALGDAPVVRFAVYFAVAIQCFGHY